MDTNIPNGHRVEFEPSYATVGALRFSIEAASQVYSEAQELFKLHWDEIAKNKQLMTLNINTEFYEKGVKSGRVIVVTARSEGVLVGYVVWFVYPHPHYQHVLCAEDDIHFLHKDYRRGLNGYNLIKNAEKLVSGIGVKHFVMREKVGHEHAAMMRRLGYNPTDIVYTKVIHGD